MKAFTVRVKLVASLILCICIHDLSHAQYVTTIAGLVPGGSTAEDIPATTANIGFVGYLNFDDTGNLIFGSNLYKIRHIRHNGRIFTIAGNGTFGYDVDGGLATSSKISLPGGVAVGKDRNVYFCDINNNRIRKVDRVTGILSTVAGTGIAGHSGDNGPAIAANINQPWDLTFDTAGNLYFLDAGNFRIRKITPTGIITSIAGTGVNGSDGDGGPATAAKLEGLESIVLDNKGSLFFSQTTRVRKLNLTTGIIQAVAGTGTSGYSGNGGPATAAAVNAVVDLAINPHNGELYISEEYNHIVRKIDKNGIINIVIGNGTSGFNGDTGELSATRLNHPRGICFDTCGNLFVADAQNYRIRKIAFNPDCVPMAVSEPMNLAAQVLRMQPNPTTGLVTVTASVPIQSVAIYNLLGQVVVQHAGSGKQQQQVDVSTLPPGMYIVRVNEVWTARLVKE